MKKIIFLVLVFISIKLNAQSYWELEEMSSMPEAVTNNAVCEGFFEQSGEIISFVYSFGGIDSTLVHSGIHNKSWRYTVETNTWESIPDIPGTEKTIASSASFVNGKIYIIGGYSVAANGNEISSSTVHIFDPISNTYSLGTNIPIAIDDHVQCVYNDSLIYIVTGWSNSSNVINVQIYNTYTNTWSTGSAVDNNSDFKVFGANGIIVGDTLYYYGGASTETNFPATNKIKKGYINPLNPEEISWTLSNISLPSSYRMACTSVNDTIYWIGGSETSYNFDAIAYDGSDTVSPSNQILQYIPTASFSIDNSFELPMDLRGIASINNTTKYICGGIEVNGKVSNKLIKLDWKHTIINAIINSKEVDLFVQNPIKNNQLVFSKKIKTIQIYDLKGQLVLERKNIFSNTINVSLLAKGMYYTKIGDEIFKILKD